MVFDRLRAVTPIIVAAGAGAVLALAVAQGLYATALLASLIAIWIAFLNMIGIGLQIDAPSPLPPAPLPPGEEERRRLTAYLDLSPAPLVALDETGRLRAVNRAARRLFGTGDLVSEPPPALLAALTATGPGRTATIDLTDADQQRSFALATSDLAVSGRMLRIGALIDIDAELKAAEASALRELVQVLSHEIVNALTPIASLADTAATMLNDPDPALPQIREALDTVARRAASLHRFGESYRSLARLPGPMPQRIAVSRLVGDLGMMFGTRWPTITFVVETQEAPSHIVADPDQLTAALWAVLQNAAEALGDTSRARVVLTVRALVGRTVLMVTDTGPGIAVADQREIFRPFFTTKVAGTGIGLALSRQIMRGHRGDLVLKSSASGGSCFEAVVPSPVQSSAADI